MKPPLKTKPKKSVGPLKRFAAVMGKVQGSLPETINPCVDVPERIVRALKTESGKNQSIPVQASLEGKPFQVNLVKYRGAWRLYLNGTIRKTAGVDVGDRVRVTLAFDPVPRKTPMPPAFAKALAGDRQAKAAFAALAPSRQKELLRYLGFLKQKASLDRNIQRMLRYLKGMEVDASPTGLYRRAAAKPRRKTRSKANP